MENVEKQVPVSKPAPAAPAVVPSPASPPPGKPAAPPEDLTLAQMETVLYPEMDRDTFVMGGQTFALRVLPWRWELEFRKSAQRILEAELKPFERVIYGITSQMHLVSGDMKVAEAVTASELDADVYLVPCVVSIMMSQDQELKAFLAKGEPPPPTLIPTLEKKYQALIEYADDMPGSPRRYLREVVRKQMEKQKLVEALGEALAGRLNLFASLAGLGTDFDGLKRDFMQLVKRGMGKALNGAKTSASASSASTAPSRTTTSPTSPAALAGLTPAGQKVAEDLERIRAGVLDPAKSEPALPTRAAGPLPSAP